MFIDFEGIDGSGKTTLSNLLAEKLRLAGYRVTHAREGGELKARISRRVRELTRDLTLLEMAPRTEFLLNLARDAQQFEEVIKPALQRGDVCISDRYVYSQLALSGGGRGLDDRMLQPALEIASQGVWPELVILVDVDPELARLRKRVGKVGVERPDGSGSRKGLLGAGLNVQMRQAFLAMARRDPQRWMVVENNDEPLFELAEAIFDAVRARLEGREPELRLLTPRPARAQRSAASLSNLDEAFYAAVDDILSREPALGVYLLSGIPGPAAHHRRLRYAEEKPRLVARSLEGLFDADAFSLRAVLARSAPEDVLQSLVSDGSPLAMALRGQLFDLAPREAVSGLKGNDSAAAWALRERALAKGELEAVLFGLAGVDSPPSWELRRESLRKNVIAATTARSLTFVSGELADQIRERLFSRDRLAVLKSVTGLDTPQAKAWREELFDQALKIVMRSLTGVDSPYAWEMRRKAIAVSKEAMDSVDGMDAEQAWSLREEYWSKWPSTALSSLRHLALTARGAALIEAVLAAQGHRVAVLRNAFAAIACAPLRQTQLKSPVATLEAP
ncbi:MAG: dTMP kinase [Myxococcaceae bacterium]